MRKILFIGSISRSSILIYLKIYIYQEMPYSGTEADFNSNQMEALAALTQLRIARRYGFFS